MTLPHAAAQLVCVHCAQAMVKGVAEDRSRPVEDDVHCSLWVMERNLRQLLQH
jgi:hypothetical protein